MLVDNINHKITPQLNGIKTHNSRQVSSALSGLKYDTVSFRAVKTIDLVTPKSKLIRTLDKILSTESKILTEEEREVKRLARANKLIEYKNRMLQEAITKLEAIKNSHFAHNQYTLERALGILNDVQRVSNMTLKEDDKEQVYENWDYALINKFKSSIMSDKYDLQEVFKMHYEPLKDIRSIEEVKKYFPTIEIPQRPEEIIAKNISQNLTRSFYEDIDNEFQNNNVEGITKIIANRVFEQACEVAEKFDIDVTKFLANIAPSTTQIIMDKFKAAKKNNSFSMFAEQKKQVPIATKIDIDLLKTDYDDFVLTVLRKQYLDSTKPNEISYTDGDIKIILKDLNKTTYKFAKVSEKVKKLIKDSLSLKKLQRNYDNYGIEDLKNRLNYYANSSISENEKIYETIIEFYSCHFLEEDIKSLRSFLRGLDNLFDGKISATDMESDIIYNNIRPVGTEKVNELERQKLFELYRLEQKKAKELASKQETFDNAINVLYNNKMNSSANICSKYRPLSLDNQENLRKSEYIIEQIMNSVKDNKIISKQKLDKTLIYWDTYNNYKKNCTNKSFIEKAEAFATENGSIDSIKAGQYIFNYEIIEAYPDCLELFESPEVIERIMEKTDKNKDKAVLYLIKYDNYNTLESEDKKKVSEMLKIFDLKDSVDKSILKHIIENDYINSDTVLGSMANKDSEISIASDAKIKIHDKYKFPRCIDLFEAFEEAAKSVASDWGCSGVKKTGSNNNALDYKMEIKINGYPDRLFSSENNYCFDVYSERGLH